MAVVRPTGQGLTCNNLWLVVLLVLFNRSPVSLVSPVSAMSPVNPAAGVVASSGGGGGGSFGAARISPFCVRTKPVLTAGCS